jgi:hypothetical protein
MTAIVAGNKVEAKWDAQKRQELTARVVGGQILAIMNVLSKASPALKEEFENQVREQRVQAFKKFGVKTPFDLVKVMAEIDANLYGSKVEIAGDDNKAQIKFEQCAVGNAIKELGGKMTPEQQQKMFEGMESCFSKTAKEFGFKSEFRPEKDKESVVITISK